MRNFKQWQQAQENERKFHTMNKEQGIKHYEKVYQQYFKYLNIDTDLKNKVVCEIGCADFPALHYCKNIGASFIIEPMPSEILKTFGIRLETFLAENVDFAGVDEVWLFNVLQHTMSPDEIIKNCKKAKTIRFFEPINYGVDLCHLHNLTFEMFLNWFEVAKYYPANNNNNNFHTHECCYGVWINPEYND